jgi:hypothetical protein
MKSLELNWIRKKVDKSIPIPEVVFHPLDGCAGKYYHPEKYELYDLDGKPYLMRYGVIVVNPECELVQTTIAHEWRHHWQYYNGIEFEISPRVDNEDYDKSLLKYFTGSKTEFDAIRFECKYTGIFPEWEKPLYSILKDLMVHPIITYGNTTLNKQKIHSRGSTSRHSHKAHKKARRV